MHFANQVFSLVRDGCNRTLFSNDWVNIFDTTSEDPKCIIDGFETSCICSRVLFSSTSLSKLKRSFVSIRLPCLLLQHKQLMETLLRVSRLVHRVVRTLRAKIGVKHNVPHGYSLLIDAQGCQ